MVKLRCRWVFNGSCSGDATENDFGSAEDGKQVVVEERDRDRERET